MAGHCHPAVVAAEQERLVTGTMYGMPHTLEYDLADEICQRFPVEQVRFGSSGTEVTTMPSGSRVVSPGGTRSSRWKALITVFTTRSW